MKSRHQRLVLGTNRPNGHLVPFLSVHRRRIARVGPNRERRQRVGEVRRMQHDAGIERDQPLRRDEQRVDVDLLDPALFDDELAEANQQLVERGEVDRRAARTPCSATKILVCSIIRRASVVLSGGSASARSR